MRQICFGCHSNFFADDDDMIAGEWVCSYCRPKTTECLSCGKASLRSRKVKYGVVLCNECKSSAQTFPNVYLMLRFKTFMRDGFSCRYCGRSPINDSSVTLHLDHIEPKSKGGTDRGDNLVTSCAECNIGKMDVVLSEYHRKLIQNRESVD